MDFEISSTAAAVSFTDDVSVCVSAVVDLTDSVICAIDVVTCCAALAIPWAVVVVRCSESLLSRMAVAVCFTKLVRLSELRDTCSIEAAISLIDDTRLSVDVATDPA